MTTAGPDGRYRTFAGQAEDPFFLDLRVFDLLYGGDFSESGDDTLAGFNVNSVALQVPRNALAMRGNGRDEPDHRRLDDHRPSRRRRQLPPGLSARQPAGQRGGHPAQGQEPVQRLGPAKDDAQFLDYVTKPELPKLIEAVYGVNAPAEPRDDLVSVFLTGVEGLNQPAGVNPSEQLRLNMSDPGLRRPGARSASSAATPRASRTVAAWPTTSSTSPSRSSRASSSASRTTSPMVSRPTTWSSGTVPLPGPACERQRRGAAPGDDAGSEGAAERRRGVPRRPHRERVPAAPAHRRRWWRRARRRRPDGADAPTAPAAAGGLIRSGPAARPRGRTPDLRGPHA